MQQNENTFSNEEDDRLINANQLGASLGIYRLKPSYTRFICWSGWIFFIIGGLILIAVIIFVLIDRQQSLVILFPALLGGLYSIFRGVLFLRVNIPRALYERVIVCEDGIIHVQRRIKNNHIDVIRWEDILAIKKSFSGQEYYIQSRDGRELILKFYQDIDNLISLMKQQSGVA